MISTRDLSRSFGDVTALDGVTLDVDGGEVLALLGPNGAGKTTTVRLLNGVLRPDRGSSRVLGLDPSVDGVELRRRTGVLTENAGLDDRLTALENIVTAAAIRGLDRPEQRCRELLERLGVGDRADDQVAGFSTGQRKRVALARSLLHDPEVLFLDEPTSGLDPEATREVVGLIAELARDHGRTIVLCTHFLGEAGRLADRMAVLEQGRVLAHGTPSELAADLLPTTRVRIDVGGPIDPPAADELRTHRGVTDVVVDPDGVVVEVDHRDAVPDLVAHLVGTGAAVRAVVPHDPTLEDVYFEVLRRRGGDDGTRLGEHTPGRISDSGMWTGAGRR